jgi:hypothetical protein
MKSKSIPIIAAAALCLALAPSTFAQPNNSMLYRPNVDLTAGAQNGFTGIVGAQFYTPYYYNVSVNYLGYADPTGAALTASHTVSLWDFGGSVVASAVVPSGTPTLWANGYAWVPLSSTVTLTYQNYYHVGATVVGGVDSWGDLISNVPQNGGDNGNNGQITWNVVNGSWGGDPNSPFVQAGSGWEFSRVAEYDYNTSDAGNPNPSFNAGSQNSIYPAPNVGYNIVPAPEPASVGLVGGGLVAIMIMRRRKS